MYISYTYDKKYTQNNRGLISLDDEISKYL